MFWTLFAKKLCESTIGQQRTLRNYSMQKLSMLLEFLSSMKSQQQAEVSGHFVPLPLCTFATSYLCHFVPLPLRTLDTSYLFKVWSDFGHFVPWTLRTFLQDTLYLLTSHFVPSHKTFPALVLIRDFCIIYDYFVIGWLWNKSKSNQLLLFCWDQGAILTIAWLSFSLQDCTLYHSTGVRHTVWQFFLGSWMCVLCWSLSTANHSVRTVYSLCMQWVFPWCGRQNVVHVVCASMVDRSAYEPCGHVHHVLTFVNIAFPML